MIIAHKNPTKSRGLSLFEWANKGGGLLFACFVGNGESVGQLGIHEKGVLLSCFFATVPVLQFDGTLLCSMTVIKGPFLYPGWGKIAFRLFPPGVLQGGRDVFGEHTHIDQT